MMDPLPLSMCFNRMTFPNSDDTAWLCTRPKGHKGNHRMEAPMWPRFEWTRKGRIVHLHAAK